jgi:hypothetical protein
MAALICSTPEQNKNFQYRDVEVLSSSLRETSGDVEPQLHISSGALAYRAFRSHIQVTNAMHTREGTTRNGLRPRRLPLSPRQETRSTPLISHGVSLPLEMETRWVC